MNKLLLVALVGIAGSIFCTRGSFPIRKCICNNGDWGYTKENICAIECQDRGGKCVWKKTKYVDDRKCKFGFQKF